MVGSELGSKDNATPVQIELSKKNKIPEVSKRRIEKQRKTITT